MSSLLNDVAERVGDVFAASFKDAGYDPKAAPIYAHALVGMVTFVGRVVDRDPQAARRGGREPPRGAGVDGPAPPAEEAATQEGMSAASYWWAPLQAIADL